jgi:hypothetical protein
MVALMKRTMMVLVLVLGGCGANVIVEPPAEPTELPDAGSVCPSATLDAHDFPGRPDCAKDCPDFYSLWSACDAFCAGWGTTCCRPLTCGDFPPVTIAVDLPDGCGGRIARCGHSTQGP